MVKIQKAGEVRTFYSLRVLHPHFGEIFCLHLQQALRSLMWDVLPKLFTPFKCCRVLGFHSGIAEDEPVVTKVSKDYSAFIFRVL